MDSNNATMEDETKHLPSGETTEGERDTISNLYKVHVNLTELVRHWIIFIEARIHTLASYLFTLRDEFVTRILFVKKIYYRKPKKNWLKWL